MEKAAGVRYFHRKRGGIETAPDCPVLVRYADDAVALCHSRQQAEQVKARLAEWLAPRGLAFNEDKTQVVHLALLTELILVFSQVRAGVSQHSFACVRVLDISV